MKPAHGWVALSASLALACGSDNAPGDDAAGRASAVAGHAGVSAPAAGSSAGGVAAGGKASDAATSGQSGGGGTGAGGASGATHAGDGNTTGGGSGAAASAGLGGAGATPGAGGLANATGAGAAGMNGGADGGRGMLSGGRDGAGGASPGGGAGAGGSSAAGAGGNATGPFVCNQVTGGQLVEEWFIAGFEKVVDDPRWQVKWRVDGYLEEWANPQSSFWTAQVDSKCANDTGSPDRIVFPVVSFTSRSRADWVKTIEQAISTFKGKYSGIRRMDLLTQIRGPDNMLCPTAPTQGESIVVPPELDGAIDDVAAAHLGFVFVGPRVEAGSCSEIQGGGPHLTSAGNTAAAMPISTYFVAAE